MADHGHAQKASGGGGGGQGSGDMGQFKTVLYMMTGVAALLGAGWMYANGYSPIFGLAVTVFAIMNAMAFISLAIYIFRNPPANPIGGLMGYGIMSFMILVAMFMVYTAMDFIKFGIDHF